MSTELNQKKPGHVAATSATEARSVSRLNEFLTFCSSEYNLPPAYGRLIASCLIPCHPHKPIWITFDTHRHPFWDSLDYALKQLGFAGIQNAAAIRDSNTWSYQQTVTQVHDWMMAREERARIFIDTGESRTSITLKSMLRSGHPYLSLCTESIRARVFLEMTRLPSPGADAELARLLKLVIDPNRRMFPNPVRFPEPLLPVLHAIAKLNVDFEVTPSAFSGLSLLPSSHAAMCGRDYLAPDDWEMLKLAFRGIIPQPFHPIIEWFEKNVLVVKSRPARAMRLPNRQQLANHIAKPVKETFWLLNRLSNASLFKIHKYQTPKAKPWYRRPAMTIGWDVTEVGETLTKFLYDKESPTYE